MLTLEAEAEGSLQVPGSLVCSETLFQNIKNNNTDYSNITKKILKTVSQMAQ